jgi:hypothetical protein
VCFSDVYIQVAGEYITTIAYGAKSTMGFGGMLPRPSESPKMQLKFRIRSLLSLCLSMLLYSLPENQLKLPGNFPEITQEQILGVFHPVQPLSR